MLINAQEATLLVVDIQEKLVPATMNPQQHVANVKKLICAAVDAGVPVVFSEQYPQGIGHTLQVLLECAPEAEVVEKMHFSCVSSNCLPATVLTRRQVILCGMEAHVCVLQTAVELKALGLDVFVVQDCVTSRSQNDFDMAMVRYQQEGVYLLTREMVLFESLRVSGTDLFRQMSRSYLVEPSHRLSSDPQREGALESGVIAKQDFAAILDQLPAAGDTLSLFDSDTGRCVATLENKPGQAGSQRVYRYLLAQYEGWIDAKAAQAGLKLYAQHTLDAIAYPGKHPNIDRLFAIISGELGPLSAG